MALYVQLENKKGEQTWHTVASYAAEGGEANSSFDFRRRFKTGCGLDEVANASRLAEADSPPWTNRHVAKGCFATAQDPQEGVTAPKKG